MIFSWTFVLKEGHRDLLQIASWLLWISRSMLALADSPCRLNLWRNFLHFSPRGLIKSLKTRQRKKDISCWVILVLSLSWSVIGISPLSSDASRQIRPHLKDQFLQFYRMILSNWLLLSSFKVPESKLLRPVSTLREQCEKNYTFSERARVLEYAFTLLLSHK